MYPSWLLRSWIEPTSRPLFFTNSGVTRFTRAPLSIRQVVFTPSIIAVPKFEWSNHRFLGSSFQKAEGVSRGFVNFWPGPDRPWPYPSGGPGLPWPWLPHPGLMTVFSGLLFTWLASMSLWVVQCILPNDGPLYCNWSNVPTNLPHLP